MKIIYRLLLIALVGTVVFMMIPSFRSEFSTQQEGLTCYENICTKTTLDQFESCLDLGIENTGFFSSEHYYLCDGNKVTNNCLEYKKVETNRTYMIPGMYCEEDRE